MTIALYYSMGFLKLTLLIFTILIVYPNVGKSEGRKWSTWFQQDVINRYMGGLPRPEAEIEQFSWNTQAPAIEFSERELNEEILRIIEVNSELGFIKESAQKFGVEVSFKGPTAVALAHYAAENLRFKKGDLRYNPALRDNHFSNIFPFEENFTLFLGIEGGEQKSSAFLQFIESRLRFSKFKIQRKDLFFASDVIRGQISVSRTLPDPRSKETLESCIQLLIEASRYKLALAPELSQFVKETISQHRYTGDASKIFLLAADLDYTKNLIRTLDPSNHLAPAGSVMRRFYDKENLAVKPLGRGTGKTAKELGLTYLTHQTEEMRVFSAITGSKVGRPNLFISRQMKRASNGDIPGELARRGNGFYTMKGKDSEWHPDSGDYKVIFKIHPEARVGHDFFMFNSEVVIVNSAAVEIAHLDGEIDSVKYIQSLLVKDGYSTDVLFRHRWRIQVDLISNLEARKTADEFILQHLEKTGSLYDVPSVFLEEYLKLPITNSTGKKVVDLLAKMVERTVTENRNGLFVHYLWIWANGIHAANYRNVIEQHLATPTMNGKTYVMDNILAYIRSPIQYEPWFIDAVKNSPHNEQIMSLIKNYISADRLSEFLAQPLIVGKKLRCSVLFGE